MKIGAGDILRIILIITGVYMMIITIASLAKRKMNESFCLAWGVVSLAVILCGILLRPSGWKTYISGTGLALILVIVFALLYAAFFVSIKVSELTRKNQELAIQVSLLNHENEKILKRIAELTDQDVRDL